MMATPTGTSPPRTRSSRSEIRLRVRDWTATPGARLQAIGPFSGEEYRESVLVPAFETARRDGVKLVVDLDGTAGYATSFLDEAFGGLARQFGASVVRSTLVVESDEDPDLLEEVDEYLGRQ